MACFPQHLQDTRKALRHHKAGNHAVITTGVGGQRGSLTFERGWGSPHCWIPHTSHASCKKLTGGKEAFLKPAILSSDGNENKKQKQHPFSHTTVCKFRTLWEGVFQTLALVQRATAEKRPAGLRVLDTNAGKGSDLQICAKSVSSSSWALPYVPDLVFFVIVFVLVIFPHGPGVYPQLPLLVLWCQLPLVLQIIQQDHGAAAAAEVS